MVWWGYVVVFVLGAAFLVSSAWFLWGLVREVLEGERADVHGVPLEDFRWPER